MSSINPIDIVPHWRDVAKGVTKSSKKKDAAEKKEAFEKKDTVEKKYASKEMTRLAPFKHVLEIQGIEVETIPTNITECREEEIFKIIDELWKADIACIPGSLR